MKSVLAYLIFPFPRFSTEEDTAKSPEDFSDVGFNVTFNEGDTNGATRQATFTIIDDEIVEADKTFNVKLTSIDPGFTPATFSSMAIRIIDNDSKLVINALLGRLLSSLLSSNFYQVVRYHNHYHQYHHYNQYNPH